MAFSGAIERGAVNRLRPKLMTVAAIMLGLLPALWSAGTGAEVMQRMRRLMATHQTMMKR